MTNSLHVVCIIADFAHGAKRYCKEESSSGKKRIQAQEGRRFKLRKEEDLCKLRKKDHSSSGRNIN